MHSNLFFLTLCTLSFLLGVYTFFLVFLFPPVDTLETEELYEELLGVSYLACVF